MSTNNKYLYTFEDVQKKAKEYGFEDSYMSDADWQLARVNPDAGMAIVGYKNDWLTATTPEQKAWANAAAEDVRSRFGNYSGGESGGSFTPLENYTGGSFAGAGSTGSTGTNGKYMYTYDDVLKKAQDFGFGDGYMSESDLKLSQMNPDAGMGIVYAKNDWLTATTDEQRAAANERAEGIRSQYGNYSGGQNGASFTPIERPTETPTETQERESVWEEVLNATARNLQNRKFEWSPETDPMVKYYEDAYRREGERAMKDVLGAVASTTGGIPSSYATAAAAQQRNYYAQQMADKYPELYKQAFDQFIQEYDNDYRMLEMYSQLSRDETDKWYKEQDIGLRGRDLDITENQYSAQNEIEWAKVGLQDEDIQQKYNLAYAQLNQDDRHFVDELLYKYDVMSEEGKQFWAKLAEDGRIADADLQYKYDALSQEAQQFIQEYALEVSKFEAEKEIEWAKVGLQEKDIQEHYKLEYEKLNQNDQQFVKRLLYDYDVLTQEGEQFWAKLAQDGEIADKEIQLEYDKLDQNTKNFLMEYALEVSKFKFEQDVHADEVRLTEAEIQLQYDKMDADKQEHLRNLAFSYYELAQQASQWSDEQKLRAQQLGIEADKIKVSASLQEWETAAAAAEFGDFSYLKNLGVDTSDYQAIWDKQVDQTLNPAEEEELPTEDDIPEGVVDAYVGQTGNTFGSSQGRPSKKADGTWDMNVLLAKEKEGRPLSDEEKAALAAYHKTMGHIK